MVSLRLGPDGTEDWSTLHPTRAERLALLHRPSAEAVSAASWPGDVVSFRTGLARVVEAFRAGKAVVLCGPQKGGKGRILRNIRDEGLGGPRAWAELRLARSEVARDNLHGGASMSSSPVEALARALPAEQQAAMNTLMHRHPLLGPATMLNPIGSALAERGWSVGLHVDGAEAIDTRPVGEEVSLWLRRLWNYKKLRAFRMKAAPPPEGTNRDRLAAILQRSAEEPAPDWTKLPLVFTAHSCGPWTKAAMEAVDLRFGNAPGALDATFVDLGPLDEEEVLAYAAEKEVPWSAPQTLAVCRQLGNHPAFCGMLFLLARSWSSSPEGALEACRREAGPMGTVIQALGVAFRRDPQLGALARELAVPRNVELPTPQAGVDLDPGPIGSERWLRLHALLRQGLLRFTGNGFVGPCPLLERWLRE